MALKLAIMVDPFVLGCSCCESVDCIAAFQSVSVLLWYCYTSTSRHCSTFVQESGLIGQEHFHSGPPFW
jgi:hypothetical protein